MDGRGETVVGYTDESAIDISGIATDMDEARMPILVHTCCGPCSTSVVERLAPDYDITLYYYNPNITDEEEYRRRYEALKKFVTAWQAGAGAGRKLALVAGPYEPAVFLRQAEGLDAEPEGGRRCLRCFELRLSRTAEYAVMHGFEVFTTTLSVSPHKDFTAISQIGRAAALKYGIRFLAEDFKKRDGYRRSVELSKQYGLYRQDYCGCEFSRREAAR